MSNNVFVRAARDNHDIPSAERMTLLVLATYMNREGICWPSTAELAEARGVDRRSIQRHLKSLLEGGYIVRSTNSFGRVEYQFVTTPVASETPSETPSEATPVAQEATSVSSANDTSVASHLYKGFEQSFEQSGTVIRRADGATEVDGAYKVGGEMIGELPPDEDALVTPTNIKFHSAVVAFQLRAKENGYLGVNLNALRRHIKDLGAETGKDWALVTRIVDTFWDDPGSRSADDPVSLFRHSMWNIHRKITQRASQPKTTGSNRELSPLQAKYAAQREAEIAAFRQKMRESN